jgi:cytochrome c2
MLTSRFLIQSIVLCLIAVVPSTAVAQDIVSAAQSGDVAALRAALPPGSHPDPEALIRPLYFASQRGNSDAAIYLLEQGAPANAVTSFGTALEMAARGNHTEIVSALLAAGADPNLPGGEDGKTPLHDAAERGAIEAARLLLQNGADVNARTVRWDQLAIHLAARKGQTEMVALLREMGVGPAPVDPLVTGELEAADLEKGRIAVLECGGCHGLTLTSGAIGHGIPAPNLVGVVGRNKASLEGFPYSEAMRAQTGTWTPDELNIFLSDPTSVVPGTEMGRGRQTDRAVRVAVIAYLASLTAK